MGFVEVIAQTADDPNLRNITNLEQLDIMRHDLDGDGVPTPRGLSEYNRLFDTTVPIGDTDDADATRPNTTPTHTGYELRNNLDFAGTKWENATGGTFVGLPADRVPGGWVPIGDAGASLTDVDDDHAFTATFDGNGYAISNLFINTSTIRSVGFFGAVGNGGEIRNLGLEGGSIAQIILSGEVGSLAGRLTETSTIKRCYATVNVNGLGLMSTVGGLVGYNNGEIRGSYAEGDVTASIYAGGLVGDNEGKVKACYAEGNILSTQESSYTGGLLGKNTGEIRGCYAIGNVTAQGNTSSVGGFIGDNSGDIGICYATGNVTAQGDDSTVGGLVGINSTTINACYATGNVLGGNNDETAGGLIGHNDEGAIRYSYARNSTVSVSATTDTDDSIGGLVGEDSRGSFTDSYFDHSTSNRPATDTGAKSSDELKRPEPVIYVSWSIQSDDWNLCDENEYPKLKFDIDENGMPSVVEFGSQGNCVTQKTKITDIESSLSTQETKITDIESSLSTQETKITDIKSSLSTQETKITDIEGSQAMQDTKITDIESSLSTQETKITDIESSLNTQETKITDIESSQDTQDTKITALESSLEALTSRLQALLNANTGGSAIYFDVSSYGVGDAAQVYPNPASRVIRFKGLSLASSYSYAIYTLGGSKVLAGSLVRELIDIGQLSAGQYILVLQDDRLTEVIRDSLVIE